MQLPDQFRWTICHKICETFWTLLNNGSVREITHESTINEAVHRVMWSIIPMNISKERFNSLCWWIAMMVCDAKTQIYTPIVTPMLYHVSCAMRFNLWPEIKKPVHFGFDNSYNPGQSMFHNSKVHARVDLWQNFVSYNSNTNSNVHKKTAEIKIKEKTHTKNAFIAPSSGFTCFLLKHSFNTRSWSLAIHVMFDRDWRKPGWQTAPT